MFLVFIVTIVTVCVTIVVTYFLLNNEDYLHHHHDGRGQPPFCACHRSPMSVCVLLAVDRRLRPALLDLLLLHEDEDVGLLPDALYFSYMAIFCLALGVMCGTLGYTGCSIFVIYCNIKSD